MHDYLELFASKFAGYAHYLWREITEPGPHSFFWWLIVVSVLVYAAELVFAWRKDQPRIRKDFWLDAFYMFFNVFLFSLVGFAAVSDVGVRAFEDLLRTFGIENTVALEVGSWPAWTQLLVLAAVRDFVQWNIHRLLHRVPWLWEFHKVHHSVEQMGFAAQLRFHWMESVVYRTLEYLPLALIGFGIEEFLVVHVFALAVGHLNHANLYLPIGRLRYLLNTPQMHIWHHMREFPAERPYGVNFGLTLSVWDWLFGTAYWPDPAHSGRASGPDSGRDIDIGIPDSATFPQTFLGQIGHPWSARRARGATDP